MPRRSLSQLVLDSQPQPNINPNFNSNSHTDLNSLEWAQGMIPYSNVTPIALPISPRLSKGLTSEGVVEGSGSGDLVDRNGGGGGGGARGIRENDGSRGASAR